jgi:hypothetical protein
LMAVDIRAAWWVVTVVVVVMVVVMLVMMLVLVLVLVLVLLVLVLVLPLVVLAVMMLNIKRAHGTMTIRLSTSAPPSSRPLSRQSSA